jgi:hypothetical protein
MLRWSQDEQADMIWLDGVLAYHQHDSETLARARRALSDHAAEFSLFLARSLAALAADIAGNRAAAARELVQLEREIADHAPLVVIGSRHPLLATVNRRIAASWLRSLGEDTEAAHLLTWHEAMPGPPLLQAWQRSVGALSLLDRAEIAEAMGEPERARRYYARLLAQYDLPVPALQPRLARAEAALARLAAGPAR